MPLAKLIELNAESPKRFAGAKANTRVGLAKGTLTVPSQHRILSR